MFLGLRHPNPAVPEMPVATELQALSAQLGLTGKHVFFNPGWVPYERRADFLLDADVAVSTHLDHLETRYSFRSRVLDYLWAGLPMVLTAGDVLADEVADGGPGRDRGRRRRGRPGAGAGPGAVGPPPRTASPPWPGATPGSKRLSPWSSSASPPGGRRT